MRNRSGSKKWLQRWHVLGIKSASKKCAVTNILAQESEINRGLLQPQHYNLGTTLACQAEGTIF